MRRRWQVLAALAGAAAALVVVEWPVVPLWRSGPDTGRLEGFSPDSRVFVTTRITSANRLLPNPEVLRWDADTGALLSRAEMLCADPAAIKAISPSPDGRIALVGEGIPIDPSRADFGSGHWFLHDGVTGQRRGGTIPGVAMVSPRAFSPDGRWFAGMRGDPTGGFASLTGIDLFSAETGERILALPDRDGLRAFSCFFAPDSATAAIAWIPQEWKPTDVLRCVIRVVELPSGRERQTFELPPRNWVRVERWDGQRLQAVAREPDGPPGQLLWTSWTFDLSRDPPGDGVEDPMLYGRTGGPAGDTYWQDGPGWVAYFAFVKPNAPKTRLEEWRDWLAAKVGRPRPTLWGLQVTASVVDRATGRTRYRSPFPLHHPCLMSPDGRRLACATEDHGVTVWDVDPPPRWPAAVAAGMAAAGVCLALGRWSGRRVRPES